MALGLTMLSVCFLNNVKVEAAWRKNSIGWWYTQGNSWATGWKLINGNWYYFDSNGYMQTGWIKSGQDWYYLYGSGEMAKNTVIGQYKLDSSGRWIQNNGYTSQRKITFVNPGFIENVINIAPQCAYYENGKLVIVAYINNGFNNHTVTGINNLNMQIFSDNVIAEAYFDSLNGINIAPHSTVLWTFTFPDDTLKVKNADLTNLFTKYNFNHELN